MYDDLVKRLREACIDWDGSTMKDGEPAFLRCRDFREAAAAIEDLQHWRDISEAPKDGTRILIACKYGLGVREGRWTDYGNGRMAFLLIAGRDVDPTAWRPLPSPPGEGR